MPATAVALGLGHIQIGPKRQSTAPATQPRSTMTSPGRRHRRDHHLCPISEGAYCPKTSLRKRAIATLYCASARTSEGFCGCVKPWVVPL